jgi:hypothetical protein
VTGPGRPAHSWNQNTTVWCLCKCVRCFAEIAVLLIAPAAVAAQGLDDVEFRIGVTRNPPVFRIGERIDLELRFSTRAGDKYKITTGSANRFVPTGENYSVSPADGVVDPR